MVRDVVIGRSLVDLLLVGGVLRCGVESCRIHEGRGRNLYMESHPRCREGRCCMIDGRAGLA
jgi:hypothetical protein